MKILSKSTGIVYNNITLVKTVDGRDVELIDTENVKDGYFVDLKNYNFAYTYICVDCVKIANKQNQSGGIGSYCVSEKCNSDSEVCEVWFTEEEIHNDFEIIK